MIVEKQKDQILLSGHQKNKVGFGGVLQWIFWNLVIFLYQCCSEPDGDLLASWHSDPRFEDTLNMNLSELFGYDRLNGKLSCSHTARKLENIHFLSWTFQPLEQRTLYFAQLKANYYLPQYSNYMSWSNGEKERHTVHRHSEHVGHGTSCAVAHVWQSR